MMPENEKNKNTSDYRSTADLAAALGVTKEAITKALRQKRIKGIRAGYHWRIPVEEYERVLREGYR